MKIVIVQILVLLVGAINFGYFAFAQESDPSYYLKTDNPHDLPYGNWITKYWDWWANVPFNISPKNQDNHYNCFLHDDGKVVYLVDVLTIGTVSYSCDIPANRSIFIPIVTTEYDTGLEGLQDKSDEGLKTSAIADNDGATITPFKLDGREIEGKVLEELRASSPYWNLTVKPGNHYLEGSSAPGSWKAIAEGYYVFLKPLEPGNHTIFYNAKSLSLATGNGTYALNVNASLDKAVAR